MNRLEGKSCLVTAAGQGIGRASALAMHQEGARVTATDINEKALAELADKGLETFVLNVRDPQSIAQAADKVGPVNVLFNCAGFVDHGTILECDDEAWAFSLDLNVTAMYRMMRAFLPAIIKKGGS
jgi:2-keto-3-deoxy-L-fuconate dehydrogenase